MFRPTINSASCFNFNGKSNFSNGNCFCGDAGFLNIGKISCHERIKCKIPKYGIFYSRLCKTSVGVMLSKYINL